jgi:hypothetical protein
VLAELLKLLEFPKFPVDDLLKLDLPELAAPELADLLDPLADCVLLRDLFPELIIKILMIFNTCYVYGTYIFLLSVKNKKI